MHQRAILSPVIYFLLSTLSSLPLLVSLLFLCLVSVFSFSLLFLFLIHKLYSVGSWVFDHTSDDTGSTYVARWFG